MKIKRKKKTIEGRGERKAGEVRGKVGWATGNRDPEIIVAYLRWPFPLHTAIGNGLGLV